MTARAIAFALLAVLTFPVTAAQPPRFTEEREAAALHFVKKHCPELSPLLDELKKGNRAAYEKQIRETFQVTELLANLQDDPKRHELQLNMWKAENKALVLVAKLAAPKDEDRKAVEEQLRALAKELVGLEVQSLEHQAVVLERELAEAKDELAKARDNFERSVKDKFDGLIEKARKRRG
jgi:hypothetical protein